MPATVIVEPDVHDPEQHARHQAAKRLRERAARLSTVAVDGVAAGDA